MTTREVRNEHERTPAAASHEHSWEVESRHRTSIGEVLYVRCAGCGTRRVDLHARVHTPAVALSRPLRP
ncbi:hypothetical protein [Rhodococcus phenolicus]|uniref:hypothetical protein n=1 Tax=Rhodococcus phenolicus TaxID=263849 RepID=UPI00082D3735|nr:hypothetical protein [Rhodococcus phenolicus]